MSDFLVDANLSRRIDAWTGDDFRFVADIDDEWTDSQIWDYARQNNLTIISKDADFANRIIVSSPPPKIIHFRIGNMRLGETVSFIDSHWDTIRHASADHKLVIVHRNRIEVIK